MGPGAHPSPRILFRHAWVDALVHPLVQQALVQQAVHSLVKCQLLFRPPNLRARAFGLADPNQPDAATSNRQPAKNHHENWDLTFFGATLHVPEKSKKQKLS